jgi:hypothetical protein
LAPHETLHCGPTYQPGRLHAPPVSLPRLSVRRSGREAQNVKISKPAGSFRRKTRLLPLQDSTSLLAATRPHCQPPSHRPRPSPVPTPPRCGVTRTGHSDQVNPRRSNRAALRNFRSPSTATRDGRGAAATADAACGWRARRNGLRGDEAVGPAGSLQGARAPRRRHQRRPRRPPRRLLGAPGSMHWSPRKWVGVRLHLTILGLPA